MRRPQIVFVAPQPPYPLTNGMPIRLFQLLKAYAECGSVKLVCLYQGEAELEALNHLAKFCEQVYPVPMSTTRRISELARLSRWRRRLELICDLRPVGMVMEFSADMANLIEQLAQSADLVHVTAIHTVGQVEGLLRRRRGKTRFVLDMPDVESARHASVVRRLPLSMWPHIAFGYYETARLWASERSAIRRFDRVLVCSEQERARLSASNVVVIPNATTIPADRRRGDGDGRTIIFCGTLSYAPNVDAVEFFVTRILPRIQRDVPDVQFVIVGRAPGAKVLGLHDGVTVRIAADVPSVDSYYASAALAVVPLRAGGGTRLKILEAWAHGVPVVSTSLGCEGLDASDGDHLLIAETPDAFAARCVEVLRRPELRRRLAERGRDLVSRRYSAEAVEAQIIAMLADVTGCDGSTSPQLAQASSCSERSAV